MSNRIVWASIPTTDFARAVKFYSHVIGKPVVPMPGMEDQVASFPPVEDGAFEVSADISAGGTPSLDGITAYLGGNGDIDGMIERVVEAGGRIIQEKQFMGDMVGWVAFFEDSEGNRVGIQQPGQ
jgi:uncharacterized protein